MVPAGTILPRRSPARPAAVLAPRPPAAKLPQRKRRNDDGKRRGLQCLNRLEDRGLLDGGKVCEIDQKVHTFTESVSRSIGHTGWKRVARATTDELQCQCREAGMPEAAVRKLKVTKHYVERFDIRAAKKLGIYKRDAKRRHNDRPDIWRDWNTLAYPFRVMVGDGTPLDILHLRSDGSQEKISLILWMDGKTRRLFWHAYVRPIGEGVRQEHTAMSFAIIAENIGLPDIPLLDNGSEYNWARLLKGLVDVRHAKPYNARAKPIESRIGILQKYYLSTIQGYLESVRKLRGERRRSFLSIPPGAVCSLMRAHPDEIGAREGGRTAKRGRW